MTAARHLLLGTCLSAAACLQPIGFPWQADATTSGATATTSTTEAPTTGTTAEPTSTTTDATTLPADASTSSTTSSSSSTTSTTTSSSSTTADATTGPGPACGDGEVDPGEDCDDANQIDDDGCNHQCGRDRVVFVTDAVWSGDQLGGLAGADAKCRAAAQKAGLANPLTFKAWLSDRHTDAVDRLVHGKGRYVRVDGLPIADDFADLLDGALANPIVITETEQVYENGVWTGTRPDGTRGVGADHCQDWSFADLFDPQNGGFRGRARQTACQRAADAQVLAGARFCAASDCPRFIRNTPVCSGGVTQV